MEEEDLLELALEFFNLKPDFTEEEFHIRYRELAKKFHPDSSEYTSTILFNELIRSKEILESHLKKNSKNNLVEDLNSPAVSTSNKKDASYALYKKAKEEENIAILEYFEKTKGNPIFLNPEENPPLKKLIASLAIPLQAYNKILTEFPDSIWANDAKDSIKRLGAWLGRKNNSVGGT